MNYTKKFHRSMWFVMIYQIIRLLLLSNISDGSQDTTLICKISFIQSLYGSNTLDVKTGFRNLS